MRFIGILFLGLTFLAGITVGTLEIALINMVVFCALTFGVIRFLQPRYGDEGLMYGMASAFFVSFLWPYLLIASRSGEDCQGDACLAQEPIVAAEPIA